MGKIDLIVLHVHCLQELNIILSQYEIVVIKYLIEGHV